MSVEDADLTVDAAGRTSVSVRVEGNRLHEIFMTVLYDIKGRAPFCHSWLAHWTSHLWPYCYIIIDWREVKLSSWIWSLSLGGIIRVAPVDLELVGGG